MDGYQVVMVWTTGAAVGYAAAKRKGYSPVAGAAAGAVLGPLLAWVLFLIDGIFSSNELRPCPHCAEWIHPKATVCRFCGREAFLNGPYTCSSSLRTVRLTSRPLASRRRSSVSLPRPHRLMFAVVQCVPDHSAEATHWPSGKKWGCRAGSWVVPLRQVDVEASGRRGAEVLSACRGPHRLMFAVVQCVPDHSAEANALACRVCRTTFEDDVPKSKPTTMSTAC